MTSAGLERREGGEEEQEEGAAGVPLFLSSLEAVSSPRLGGGGLLISFLYDSQSALLKYAICSEQSEDDKCRNQSGKESLNEADLRSLPPGESGFLPPPLFFLSYDKLPQHGQTARRPGPGSVYACTLSRSIPHRGLITRHRRTPQKKLITNMEAQYIFIRAGGHAINTEEQNQFVLIMNKHIDLTQYRPLYLGLIKIHGL